MFGDQYDSPLIVFLSKKRNCCLVVQLLVKGKPQNGAKISEPCPCLQVSLRTGDGREYIQFIHVVHCVLVEGNYDNAELQLNKVLLWMM